MSSNLVETLIGFAVLLLAGWFLLFVEGRTQADTDGAYQLQAYFDRVDGIAVGSDVRLSGIKVGSVVRSELDKETYQAVLTFSVAKDVQLPHGTAAAVSADGLLGGAYLSLLPGGGDDFMKNGDIIEETQDAVDLVGLIGKFVFGGDDGDSNSESKDTDDEAGSER